MDVQFVFEEVCRRHAQAVEEYQELVRKYRDAKVGRVAAEVLEEFQPRFEKAVGAIRQIRFHVVPKEYDELVALEPDACNHANCFEVDIQLSAEKPATLSCERAEAREGVARVAKGVNQELVKWVGGLFATTDIAWAIPRLWKGDLEGRQEFQFRLNLHGQSLPDGEGIAIYQPTFWIDPRRLIDESEEDLDQRLVLQRPILHRLFANQLFRSGRPFAYRPDQTPLKLEIAPLESQLVSYQGPSYGEEVRRAWQVDRFVSDRSAALVGHSYPGVERNPADTFAWHLTPSHALVALCDGCGWHHAARAAARNVARQFIEKMSGRDGLGKGSIDALVEIGETRQLLQRIRLVVEKIPMDMPRDGETTFVGGALVPLGADLRGKSAFAWYAVGDCSIFRKRGREVIDLLPQPAERDQRDPGGYLASQPDLKNLRSGLVPLEGGDLVIMTSDGFGDNLPKVWPATLTEPTTPQEMVEALLRYLQEKADGSDFKPDDISVLVRQV